jgi:hypothetical protein
VVAGALEVSGGAIGRVSGWLPDLYRFSAITFGHVILGTDERGLEECREHEQIHVRQYERWGALFLPLYLGSSLVAWLRGGDPYFDNVFEREAFARTGPSRRPRT